ncbi:MAG: TraR/DksA family transcriptional regulator [Saprospiraceae bacterium]
MENLQSTRYSETDLAIFKAAVNKKLAKAERQLASLDAQLKETTLNKGSQSDWVEDSSSSANLQLLDTMANRLRKHLVDLKNALLRIHNKSYGICSLTGQLIDKKRLLAVPTTTKGVAAKTANNKRNLRQPFRSSISKKKSPKIISRVVKKNGNPEAKLNKPDLPRGWDETDQLLKNVEKLDLKKELEE